MGGQDAGAAGVSDDEGDPDLALDDGSGVGSVESPTVDPRFAGATDCHVHLMPERLMAAIRDTLNDAAGWGSPTRRTGRASRRRSGPTGSSGTSRFPTRTGPESPAS